ncbi:uncharacterized transmembrane protein DDB_G0289901-like [Dermacentor silvarum]|uniref:uncharacterized transmembrane protein DDB_G0289901-like n=1 Tax=Dermacentor silvarum TaxID=543639 RepID=UPI002100FD4F|nr:uncharacterized transmembrane protein DDB_G0289901-like [Dermacentor silvarum]
MNAFLVSVVLSAASLSHATESAAKLDNSPAAASFPFTSNQPASADVFSDLSGGSALSGAYTSSNSFSDGSYGDGSFPSNGWAAGGHPSIGGWTDGGSVSGFSGGSRLGGSWTGADLIGTGSFNDLPSIGPLGGSPVPVRPSASPLGKFGGASSWLSGSSIASSGRGSSSAFSSGGASLDGISSGTFGSIIGAPWSTSHGSSTGTTFSGSNVSGEKSTGHSVIRRMDHRFRGDAPYTGGSFRDTLSMDELRGSTFGSLSSGKSWSRVGFGDGSVLSGNRVFGSGPSRGQFGGVYWGRSHLGGTSGANGASSAPEYLRMNGIGGRGMSVGVDSLRWSSTNGASSADTTLSSRRYFGGSLGGADKVSSGGREWPINAVMGSSGYFDSASGRYPGRNFDYTYGYPESRFAHKLGNGGSWSSGPRGFSFRLGGSTSSSQLADTVKNFISGLGQSRSE